MPVHSLHIFDRKGKTLFTKRFIKEPQSGGGGDNTTAATADPDQLLAEQRKLVFGMLFSLREVAASLSPTNTPATSVSNSNSNSNSNNKNNHNDYGLHSVRTGATTLYNYETNSGLRFALYIANFQLPPPPPPPPVTTTTTTATTTNSSSSNAANTTIPTTPGGGLNSTTAGGSALGGAASEAETSTSSLSTELLLSLKSSSTVVGSVVATTTTTTTTATTPTVVPTPVAAAPDTSVRAALDYIYNDLWIQCVTRSPLYRPTEPNVAETNFEAKVTSFLRAQPWFR
ncbi:hypothetical protein ACA910_005569 [Epithemia clementina (nom. ined.)]